MTKIMSSSSALAFSSAALARRARTFSSDLRATKAGFLGLVGRSIDENQQGVGVAMSDLLGAVHIDLEQNVVTRRRVWHRGSLVIVEKLDPLEEAIVGDMGEKSLCVGEVVGLHRLTGPTVTSGPAAREPQGGVFVEEPGDDRSLADASGRRSRRSRGRRVQSSFEVATSSPNAVSRARRCLAPRPWTRRLSEMPMDAIVRRTSPSRRLAMPRGS